MPESKVRVPDLHPRERIVHIGLGAFHKAHQAWYTQLVDPDQQWGIVAFTVRTPDAALALRKQNHQYTLLTRNAVEDSFLQVNSILRAEDGAESELFKNSITNPDTAIVTITITEAGYGVDASGEIDHNNPPIALVRLASALESRRLLHGRGLAVVPCDNLPSNGKLLRGVMNDLFSKFGKVSQKWLESEISFVSTSVDRITPKITAGDLSLVKSETGRAETVAVATEAFSSWVLEGDFPEGRPAWEQAGAVFVNDIKPFEQRKLWLLNGAHSILAYSGLVRGYRTVAQAMGDENCFNLVSRFWIEATRNLDIDDDEELYKKELIRRFSNSRIEHQLSQITTDGVQKLCVRIIPVARAELAAGRSATASAMALATWLNWRAPNVHLNSLDSLSELALAGVGELDSGLAQNRNFVSKVTSFLLETERTLI